ncbi:MAG TPA: MlaD family protein, partial [Kofleriaceae bacterium]
MTTPATNFKLGVFALAAAGALVAAALALGLHPRRAPTTTFHTWFDESVQGLEVGAPVKYRGVRIGNVTAIQIAPDRQHLDVSFAVNTATSDRLMLATPPPLLRAQLGSTGLTGVKYIDLDFGAKALAAPPHYLPSEASLGKRLEDDGLELVAQVRELAGAARGTLSRFDRLLDETTRAELPQHVATVLESTRSAIDGVHAWLPAAGATTRDIGALARNADHALETLRAKLDKFDAAGVGTSLHATSEAFGELGRRGSESAVELAATIRDLGEAARTLRAFLDELER